ncbi:MAG: D-alanyl-D-alanine carboxypeptidase [Gammaproteobacteria bacterium]|nr:D-alanyl-D-alanine carboxypeptidase [Gammaproteobacteria bacterium]MBU1625530.1 D-alanyl-D-alanine carboxypeptidase [Gammaproteobacteria bacterium]MBU1980790.1 D-alanyl-D-alanine carboxypeptidase [Gammaproteobacteria bacterium]
MRIPIFLLCLLSGWFNSALAFPPSPTLAAKHYALYDASSGQMLVTEAADDHIAPDSLTKLMTAYVVFGAIKRGELLLTQRLTPTPYALRLQNEETRMFLEAGKEVTVEVLLRGLIVQSANDAARVLAEGVANHEIAFADHMNTEAQRLGLRDTHFTNATGEADAQHYSSAHDLVLIAAALVRDFPEFYNLYALREYSYNGINQFNRNRLLWLDPHVDGMQTAYSEETGFSLAASALREPRRLIAVVIGANKENLRTTETQRLLNHGFRQYESLPLYRKQQAVSGMHVWKGTVDQLAIGFREDRYVTIPAGQREQLSAQLETKQPLLAPVNAGQQVGTLHLSLNGQPYLDLPVVALQTVPLANVFSRGVDAIKLLFQ